MAVLFLSLPAAALTGTVLDSDAKPIRGARVCYLVARAEVLCVDVDARGRFELPESRVEKIKVSAHGFATRVMDLEEYKSPVVLQPAAALLVRLRDAETGEGIADGRLEVVYSADRKKGPFVTTLGGARIRSLEPGNVDVLARAEGYESGEAKSITLEVGKEAEVVIRLVPEKSPPASD